MRFEVGMQGSFSKTVSESDVYLFAGITGDFNPLHIDLTQAENGRFGKRIVHGVLILGFISTVIGTQIPGKGTIYLEQDIKFLGPVYIGDTITAFVKINEVLNEEKNILKLDTYVKNQQGEIVLDGFAVVMVSNY